MPDSDITVETAGTKNNERVRIVRRTNKLVRPDYWAYVDLLKEYRHVSGKKIYRFKV